MASKNLKQLSVDLAQKPSATVFEPKVSASDLVTPPTPLKFTPPATPTINPATTGIIKNVNDHVGTIIKADTEEAARLKTLREEQARVRGTSAETFQKTLDQNGTTANLKELKDINLQLADMQTGSELTKSRIASAGGQTLTQGAREITQEEKESNIRQMGLAARASVLTDNINTATALARDAVNFAFQDASLENSNRIAQINDLQGVVDGQTQQLLDQEKARIAKEDARIKEVKDAVQAAILAGADQPTIDRMLSPKTPDDEKFNLAQGVIGSSARTDINLDRAAKGASIRASNANAALNEAELATVRAKQKQIEDAVAAGEVVLDPDQQKTAMSLGKQFEDESKNFKIQANAYNQIVASATDPSAAGDLSLIFGYMKMLDPNSVVRETEFANAQNAAGVPERVRAQWNNVLKGERLSDSTRSDFLDRSSKIYGSALEQQVSLEDQYREQGRTVYGLPPGAVDLIVRDIRATGAVSEIAFGVQLNQLSDEQLSALMSEGLMPVSTPSQ